MRRVRIKDTQHQFDRDPEPQPLIPRNAGTVLLSRIWALIPLGSAAEDGLQIEDTRLAGPRYVRSCTLG